MAEPFVPEGGIVVDLGCGPSAFFLKRIAHRIRKGMGVDKQSVNNSHVNLEFLNSDVNEPIKIQSNLADLVVMLAVVEHLEKPRHAIVEAFRILRPGGRIALTFPSRGADPLLNLLARCNLIDPEAIDEHKEHFRPERVTELLSSSGFEDIVHKKFQLGLNNFVVASKPVPKHS